MILRKLAKGEKLTQEERDLACSTYDIPFDKQYLFGSSKIEDIELVFHLICDRNCNNCENCPAYQLNNNKHIAKEDNTIISTPFCNLFLSGSKFREFVLSKNISNKLKDF